MKNAKMLLILMCVLTLFVGVSSADAYTRINLHFDGGNGSTTFTDTTGRTWTAYNATQSNEQMYLGESVGKFNNTSAYIKLNTATEMDLNTSNFTLDVAVRQNSTASGNQYIFSNCPANGSAENTTFGVYLNTSGNIIATMGNGSTFTTATSWTALPKGTWGHIRVIKYANYIYIELNDSIIGQRKINAFNASVNVANYTIGRRGDYTGNYFDGYIDEFNYSIGTAYNRPVRYYAYGDSITHATNGDLAADGSDCYVVDLIRRYIPDAAADHNTDGDAQMTSWGITNFATHYDNEDYYIIAFGVNDMHSNVTSEVCANNLITLSNWAEANGSIPIVQVNTLMVEDGSYVHNYTYQRTFISEVESRLTAADVEYIKGYDAVDTTIGDGIIESPNTSFYRSDLVHFNKTGQVALADNIWRYFNPLTVSFTATPLTGSIPLAVQFTDTSTGTPTAWSWNFGDGETSTEQNPVHTYETIGSYTVTMRASNTAGTYGVSIMSDNVVSLSEWEDINSNDAGTWVTAVGLMGIIVILIFIGFAIGAIQGKFEMGTLVNASIGLMLLMLVITLGYGVLSKLGEVF